MRWQKKVKNKIDVNFLINSAEEINLPSNSIDTVLLTYTLCTIPEPLDALDEIKRVLKSDGNILFCEHGTAPDLNVQKWQNRINPLWGKLFGGCNINRDIPNLILESGLKLISLIKCIFQALRKLLVTIIGVTPPYKFMKNRPVVIGIGCIQQKGNFDDLDEALILMDKAFKKAVDDTTNKKIIDYINEIQIPKGFWKYRDPARWIANKNGIKSIETSVTKIGILQQSLINSVCNKINTGETSAGVILGGESRYKMLKASIENKKYEESELTINPNRYIKAPSDLNLDIEKKELGEMAVGYYAILESAFRAKKTKNFI